MKATTRSVRGAVSLLAVAGVCATACGNDDENDVPPGTAGSGGSGARPGNTGRACDSPDDCYAGTDGASVHGEIECLDRVEDGYCTHQCVNDADCCAIPGECGIDLVEVCSPFQSTGLMLCIISCEKEDLVPAPDAGAGTEVDPEEFCRRVASPDFHCHSSGGGPKNRKVCTPEGGGSAGAGGSGGSGAIAGDAGPG